MKRKYIVRHKILEALHKKMIEDYTPNPFLGDMELTIYQLVERTSIAEEELLKQMDYLSIQAEIYISDREGLVYYIVTQKGSDAYVNNIHLEHGEREYLTDKKLNLDLLNAKRIYKTYWWTFIFSIVAIVISITLLILKIFEK